MITRRNILTIGPLAALGATALPQTLRKESSRRFLSLSASIAQLEKSSSGRLGVAVLDTGSGEMASHRANQRFAMCSTFKMLLASAVLQRTDMGRENLDRAIDIPAKPLLTNSPLTEEHAGARMTVRELCHAILTRSDNTAANLLLATIGGPDGIGGFARSLGDQVTRLDRTEIALNEALPGDPRDTTSPAAMLGNLRRLLLNDALSPVSRDQLMQWMTANKTGDDRIRAGLPSHWRVGDKTGSNGDNTTNDIAIVWPVERPPVLITVYLTECKGPEARRNAIIAKVGRLVAASLESA
jgi:beta-lactamase class A